MKRFTFLIVVFAGFSAVSLASQVYTDDECLLEVKNKKPICPCGWGQGCRPADFEPPLTVAWFDEDAGSGDVRPACKTTFNWDKKLDKVRFWKRCLVTNVWHYPLLDQNGQTQCCLGGYGGEEKLPNPNYIQGRKISEADDSSFMLEDIAPFAE